MKKSTLFFALLLFSKAVFGQADLTANEPIKIAETPIFFEPMPQFPGGEKELLTFFAQNMIYPEKAKLNRTQGRVILELIMEKDGSVSNVRVKRDIGDGCGEEAVRIAEKMPKWRYDSGTPIVRMKMNIPVMFKLED